MEPTQTVSTAPVVKPGISTSEFWIALGTSISGAFAAHGVFASGSTAERVAGLIASAVTGLAYIWSRTKVKA